MEKTLTIVFKSGSESTVVLDKNSPINPTGIIQGQHLQYGSNGVKRITILTPMQVEEWGVDQLHIAPGSVELVATDPTCPE